MPRLYVYLNNQEARRRQPLIHQFLKSVFAKDGWKVAMNDVRESCGDEDRPVMETRTAVAPSSKAAV